MYPQQPNLNLKNSWRVQMLNEHGMNPKGNILIFSPTLGLPPDPSTYVDGLLIKIINQIQAQGMGLAYLPVYRQLWWPANNLAWNVAFEHHFEYILRIDDDIHSIPDDAIKKLLEADKDVIGAAYPNRRWPFFPAAMNRTKDISLIEICMKDDRCLQYVQGLEEGSIVPCDIIGFGMTLIKTEKFRTMRRPIYLGNEEVPDDTYFAQLCLDNGIQQFVHFGVKVAHAHVDFNNNGYLYSAGVYQKINQQKAEQEEARLRGEEIPENPDLMKLLNEPALVSELEPK